MTNIPEGAPEHVVHGCDIRSSEQQEESRENGFKLMLWSVKQSLSQEFIEELDPKVIEKILRKVIEEMGYSDQVIKEAVTRIKYSPVSSAYSYAVGKQLRGYGSGNN